MTRSWRPAHRVQLRVTNTAGKELNQNLILARIRNLNFIHHQGLVWFDQDRRSAFNAHCFASSSHAAGRAGEMSCWSMGILECGLQMHHSSTPEIALTLY
jgi:hypothetical protein